MFHREGHTIVIASFLLASIAVIGIDYFFSIGLFQRLLQIGVLVFLVLILQFFRNPKRNIKLDPSKVLAPADGKIVIIKEIIRNYTKESGVRNLEREISKIARKLVKKIDNKEPVNNPINDQDIKDLLGVQKFNYGEIEEENRIGVVTGLAWTEVGGEILKIESAVMPGKGKMQITGKLGDVMQESVKAAKSYIRSKSLEYGIIPPIFDKKDFHIHVPEGATPKDGPSAGIGMVTSIISAITEIPVNKEIAMTGEITLRGLVLPIGGLKEKLLAAHRAGIKKVLIPAENKKDLVEVPKTILNSMEIVTVKNVEEVLKIALTKPLKRVEWVEVDQISNKDKSKKELSTH